MNLKDIIIGRANTEITPELAATLGAAIGTYYGKGSVFVCSRDYRTDSRMLKRGLSAGMMSTGCTMIDMHASPTVCNQFACRRFGATAGISVSSSHRAKDDVRIRIFDGRGVDISEKVTNNIISLMNEKSIKRVPITEIGWINPVEALDIYKHAILGFINKKVISSANLRILIDCSLGPTSLIVPNALGQLNVEVISLNSYVPATEVDEVLPNPSSIQKMRKAVIATDSDLGIAIDSEGRQIIVIDSTGRIYSGDDLASILLYHFIKKGKEYTVVLSKSVSKRMDAYLTENKFNVIRESDKSGSLGRKILSSRAYFGASDRGIFHFPQFGVSSDGILALFMILELLANEKKKLSDLLRRLPTDVALTKEITFKADLDQESVMQDLLAQEEFETVDTLVGVKILYNNNDWVHIKPGSQTYSFEVILEAEPEKATEYFAKTEELIRKAINKN